MEGSHLGKSRTLSALGHAAAQTGRRIRYCTAADIVESLYRGLADHGVGKLIDGVLCNVLVFVDEPPSAPLDSNGSQLLFRFAAAYERPGLALASHWSFEDRARFPPDHGTAVSLLDGPFRHDSVVATDGETDRMRERTQSGGRRTRA